MKEAKGQTLIMVGITLFVLSMVMLYISLSSPRVYEEAIITEYNTSIAASFQDTQVVTQSPSFSGVVNLNTCTEEELVQIEGIGSKRAYQIISYRDEIGGYSSVEQIMNISGIGEGVFNEIAPYLTV